VWYEQGLVGLWTALVVGYSITSGLAMYSVWQSDWNALCEAAVARSKPTAVILTETTSLLPKPEDDNEIVPLCNIVDHSSEWLPQEKTS
jgi:hypothetical protein